MSDSIETALKLSDGLVIINVVNKEDLMFSKNYSCPEHNVSVEELTPRMFSFNSPFGACSKCTGLGVFMKIDPDMIIPDKSLSIKQGGIKGSGWAMEGNTMANMYFNALAEKYGFSLDVPISELPDKIVNMLLYGNNGEKLTLVREGSYGKTQYQNSFEGIINNLERRFRDSQSNWVKEEIESYMSAIPCSECKGKRLSKTVLPLLSAMRI